ncbi:C2 domain-containing protein [Artemisia annua]|uniref:C2 domain-containing protein n=1 Tax=Artemisia annua TaxID=35608 RepID=A0A2U1PK42_ARTAN|nr:C2 domain-containing protein [Artemisia annua]
MLKMQKTMKKMKKKGMRIDMSKITEFLNELMVEKPVLPLLIPLLLVLWSIEKWFFNLSNWVPLAVAVWATIQRVNYSEQSDVSYLEQLQEHWSLG